MARAAPTVHLHLPSPSRLRAGFVTRFAAGIADALILFVVLRGTVWLLSASAKMLRRFAPPLNLATLVIVCAPLLVALYNVTFWRLRGQTPGKWLLGVRVVPLGGGKLGVGRGALRIVGYLLSALPFYLGYLWILGPQRRGLHDRLARTEVVYDRPARASLPVGPGTTADRRLTAA
jgi:uncharacterized RDD family membrane protein YckC